MGLYYNGKKVRNLYYNGKCLTRLALGKEMTRLVEGDDFVRAEWLHFDSNGSANAEFISLPINSSVFDFTRKFIKYDNNSYFWTGSATFSYSCSQNIINVYNFENNTYVYVSNSSLASVNGIVAINSSASSLTFNEEQVPQYDFPIGSIKWRVSSVSDGAIFDTSSIYVDGVERYIPCRLLRPIPATLDANGIARNAGECGMYNLNNGLFYGNVAPDGLFTVEPSLIEGVDYERHKWLVAEIPIGVAMMSLPINSSTFNCTIEHTGARANLPHLYSNGYIYFTESSNMDMISVWDVNGVNRPFSASVGSLMTIESNEEYFQINNISIPKYGFPILRMVIQSSYNSNNASTIKTSKISVDGIERYIPVRLLRPLPPYLDANSKVRHQFECGMLDLKTMKFYGNVASSGSFTVSDN